MKSSMEITQDQSNALLNDDLNARLSLPFLKSQKSLSLSLFMIMFLIYSENFIIAPLLSEISASLHISLQLSANLVSVYTLSVGLGALFYGPLSDSIGRYKSICISLAGFSLATLMCGIAWDVVSIYVFRISAGLFAGILTSNSFAYVADYFVNKGKPQLIPVTMGKVMSGMFSAIVVGVPLGILVGYMSSWRVAFYILSALSICLLIFILVGVEHVKSSKNDGKRYFEALRGYFKFIKEPRLLKISALFFSFQFVVTAFATYSPMWIVGHGYGLLALSALYGVTGLISVFVAIQSGNLVQKLGFQKTLLLSNLFVITSLGLIASLDFNIYLLAALIAVYLSCVSLRIGPLQALSVTLVDGMERGRYSAFNSFSMQMGSSVGVSLCSVMLASGQGDGLNFSYVVYCLVGITAISTAIAISIKQKTLNERAFKST